MYDKTDPRSALHPATAAKAPPPASYFGPDYGHFYREPPQIDDASGRTWLLRGQAFVIAYSEAAPGGSFARAGQPDEYALLLPDPDRGAEIETAEGRETVAGNRIAFLPPGDSRVTLPQGGPLVRLFTPRAADLVALAPNAARYDGAGNPAVPPFAPWPDPPGGFRLRHYPLDVPQTEGRFGRIYRCTTFMVNYLYPRTGPRDRKAVSPHHHDDFEQGSLALTGRFTHHLRWPWTTDMTIWREDEHEDCGTPSLAVIPPPAIHTSTGEDQGVNQLVDIFAPPRVDFSIKKGWVLNEDDYPLPPGLTAS